jgi:hypothetical protein
VAVSSGKTGIRIIVQHEKAPERRIWVRIDPGGWENGELVYGTCGLARHTLGRRVFESFPTLYEGTRESLIETVIDIWIACCGAKEKRVPGCSCLSADLIKRLYV